MAATWRKRWLPSLPLSVTVFCFWLLMNDEISVGQVVMALVLALVIPPFAARLDRDKAARLQLHQRFAHHGAADVEVGCVSEVRR